MIGWHSTKVVFSSGATASTFTRVSECLNTVSRPLSDASTAASAASLADSLLSALPSFDIRMFKRNLERLECHVLYLFGEKSSLVDRQDVSNLANLSVKAESLTVEELPGIGPNFIRDAYEDSVDFIVDYLSGPALGCFDVPNGDAWARTPANLGLRPLPQYASIEEARKALGPRKIPTREDIEIELRKLRVEEGRAEDDDSDSENAIIAGTSGSKTALSLEPMDYFGFVG